jgi:hypothetical protein
MQALRKRNQRSRASRKGDINRASFKRLVRFLRDSGRIPWDTAEALPDYLGQK